LFYHDASSMVRATFISLDASRDHPPPYARPDGRSQPAATAELAPGDIVIRDGMPPQPQPAKAGHFLDRAL
jgi:hypothetical protein